MPETKLLILLGVITALLIILGVWAVRRRKRQKTVIAESQKPVESERSPESFLLLASDALRNKQLIQARDFAASGLDMNPQDKRTRASLTNLLGNVSAESGSRETAFKYFLEASETDPTFPFPHNNLGNIYFMEKKYSQAEQSYAEALRLKPDYADAQSNLTRLRKILNR